MSDAYIIIAEDLVAGVVLREGRRYRFSSASRLFRVLDGDLYRSPKHAERAAALVLAVRSANGSRGAPVD